jgi:hypothetical protein
MAPLGGILHFWLCVAGAAVMFKGLHVMSTKPLDYEPITESIPKPVLRALRVRKVVGVITLISFGICIINLQDGRPYQLESAGLFGLSFALYLGAAVSVWDARIEARARSRR